MKTFKFKQYIVTVHQDWKEPGEYVDVTIRSTHSSAQYEYLYRVVKFVDSDDREIACLTMALYIMKARPDGKIKIYNK